MYLDFGNAFGYDIRDITLPSWLYPYFLWLYFWEVSSKHLWVGASHGQFTSNMEFDTYIDTYIKYLI